MTALDEYDRLEAVGILKRSDEDKGTEVVVTFGEATLTMNALSDGGDTPITHWSLAAIDMIRQTDSRAVYSLNAMTEEVLEIEDATFRLAISKILQDRQNPVSTRKKSQKLRLVGVGLVILGLAFTLLPSAISNIAKGMISPERADVLASEMIPMIEERTGPACATDSGLEALKQLANRLNPDGKTTLSVHDLGDANVISLPGGRVLINRSVIETSDKSEITAWTAIGIASVIESPAISELFDGQGIIGGLKFLSSGQLPKASKEQAVNRLLASAGSVRPAIYDNAAQLLVNAGLSTEGLNTIRLDGNEVAPTPSQSPVMSEQDWSALRGVCTN